MTWRQNIITRAVVGPLLPASAEDALLETIKIPETGQPLYRAVAVDEVRAWLSRDVWEPPFLSAAPILVPPVAAGSDGSVSLSSANGNVTEVVYIPFAEIVGSDTNARGLALIGPDGVVASLAVPVELAQLPALRPGEIPVSSPAVDGALTWSSTHSGSGVADPGGLVVVTVNGVA